jgi:hypothetical protein
MKTFRHSGRIPEKKQHLKTSRHATFRNSGSAGRIRYVLLMITTSRDFPEGD